MVILVDGAPHGAKAVMAVGKDIGNGKFLHAGGAGGLDNTHVGDIVGGDGIEFDTEIFRLIGVVVGLNNPIGHGALFGLLLGDLPAGPLPQGGCRVAVIGDDLGLVQQVYAGVIELYHNVSPLFLCSARRGLCPLYKSAMLWRPLAVLLFASFSSFARRKRRRSGLLFNFWFYYIIERDINQIQNCLVRV